MIFGISDDDLWFPNPYLGDEDGLLAVGGDLSVERLLLAYSNGIFPWYSFRDSDMCHWYCPLSRFVIFPDEIHVSHSMRTLMNKGVYDVTFNEDFHGVIRNCSQLRIDEKGAWLGPDMIEAYTRLHELGCAASVEVWEKDSEAQGCARHLVGGLYGVVIGAVFIGESMFSLVPSASKLALIHLAQTMRANGGRMIDCQLETPHLKSMGGRHIPYEEYMKIMRRASDRHDAPRPVQQAGRE